MRHSNWRKCIFSVAAGILITILPAAAEAQGGRGHGTLDVTMQNNVFESFIEDFVPREFWNGMGGTEGKRLRAEGMRWFAEQMKGKPEPEKESGENTGGEEMDLTEPESEKNKERTEIIFVGDSRVVGMASAGGYCYVGEVGMGYYWLTGEGSAGMAQAMSDYPDAAVVLCFGVNDLGNIGAYIDYYQTLLDTYPDRQIYFMSVNPVDEAAAAANGYSINNEMIESFNDSLMNSFPDRYIDIYGYLMASGFGTADGIHYDAGTYAGIQNYALLMVNALQEFSF